MRKVESESQDVTFILSARSGVNNIACIILIVQAADVSSISKAAHEVIVFEFTIKIDINNFLIGLPHLFIG